MTDQQDLSLLTDEERAVLAQWDNTDINGLHGSFELLKEALIASRSETEQYESGYRYERSARSCLENIVRKIVNGEYVSTEEMVAALQHAAQMSALSPAQPIDVSFEYRDKEIVKLVEENKRLREALNSLRKEHLIVEDCWYSCPKSGDEYYGENKGGECDCGADRHNAIIDAVLLHSEKGGE